MNIWSIFRRALDLYPERTGVVDGGVRLTYAELGRRVLSIVAFLRERLAPGERIAILEDNSLPFLEFYFAAAGARAVLNPLNTRLAADELVAILLDSEARLLVASSRFAPVVVAILERGYIPQGIVWIGDPSEIVSCPSWSYHDIVASALDPGSVVEAGPDETAHLYYTSGTTGRAKGVILTHRNVTAHAMGTVVELGLSSSDVWGHFAPMFHLADAWATFGITLVGGRHVMAPKFDAWSALATIERERVTITNLIPTMLNLMVKHPEAGAFDYGSLRAVLSGGAPIAPNVVEEIIRIFRCEYIQTYGMTETSPYLTLSILKDHLRKLPPDEQFVYRAKTGRPFITVDLRVVDDAGVPVPRDGERIGEIQARGETITPGYWNRPEETAAAFSDGWLRTGDLAVIDAEGYVTIVDRRKDMIITGGENVYSTEVEHALYGHPAVLEAAVFGAPDNIFGERVVAAVVLRNGEQATAEELIAFCRERIAGYKTPRAIEFVEELPRTGSGKISKRMLREQFARFH